MKNNSDTTKSPDWTFLDVCQRLFSGFSLRPRWQNVNFAHKCSQIRNVRCIEKNGRDIRGRRDKRSRLDRTCPGQLLWRVWRRVTYCHVLWSIVTKSSQHTNIRTCLCPSLTASSRPRASFSLSSPSRIHLSRLRAARHEPLRPQQVISHPDGPRVIRVSPGRKHDQTSSGSSEYNASPLIKPISSK